MNTIRVVPLMQSVFLIMLAISPAFADDAVPEIPAHLPNPYGKKETISPVDNTKDLKLLEQILYGEVNEGNTIDGRIAALERTVFGATYSKNSMKTRLQGLALVVNHILAGRRFYDSKNWDSARLEFEEALKSIGKDYKSSAKAELHYRLGMCNYELSNIRSVPEQSSKGKPSEPVKLNGAMIRAAKENLTKAQEFYKALGQPDTAQQISTFIDSFKDKAATSFLY